MRITTTHKPLPATCTQWWHHGDHHKVTRAHKNPQLGWIWTELGGKCVLPGMWIVELAGNLDVVTDQEFKTRFEQKPPSQPLHYYQRLAGLHQQLAV
jgi:hypothetical protein